MSKEKRDKRKLEGADDAPEYSHVMRNLPPPHNLVTLDNLEDPEGGKNSNMLEAAM